MSLGDRRRDRRPFFAPQPHFPVSDAPRLALGRGRARKDQRMTVTSDGALAPDRTSLIEDSILPTALDQRPIGAWGYAWIWVGIAVIIATYSLGATGAAGGIGLGEIIVTIFLANLALGAFMLLPPISAPSTACRSRSICARRSGSTARICRRCRAAWSRPCGSASRPISAPSP